jgi:proline dehydrogenase
VLRRAWQTAMIGLARSARAKRFMQGSRAGSFLARKYVAGQAPADAVSVAGELLSRDGIRSSLFYLGEYADSAQRVTESVAAKLAVAAALGRTVLDVHVSVDPTQIGQSLDPAMAGGNARRIAEAVWQAAGGRPGAHCAMLDMEDASVVDATIALHDGLKREGLPVALTLQAYLRRTGGDLRRQIAAGSRVRLVKGAFVGAASVAYTSQREIKASYRRLAGLMLAPEARAGGFYPILATHDDALHAFAIETARRNGWRPGEYEFEMLLGVRMAAARDLARRGERVRLYLPFGRDWWPYAVRRIGENPRNALLLARSLVG